MDTKTDLLTNKTVCSFNAVGCLCWWYVMGTFNFYTQCIYMHFCYYFFTFLCCIHIWSTFLVLSCYFLPYCCYLYTVSMFHIVWSKVYCKSVLISYCDIVFILGVTQNWPPILSRHYFHYHSEFWGHRFYRGTLKTDMYTFVSFIYECWVCIFFPFFVACAMLTIFEEKF